jgi:glycosyltransferase involved in cell wall biosynthesis
MRVMLISGEYPPRGGGVADYTANLARALTEAGNEVSVITPGLDERAAHSRGEVAAPNGPEGTVLMLAVPGFRLRDLGAVRGAIGRSDPELAVFQYVPQLYGRAGVSPLAALIPLMAQHSAGTRVVTVLHELHVPWGRSVGSLVASAAQRLQLSAILAASHGVVVTNPLYLAALRDRVWRPGALAEIPVGASVPVLPVDEGERSELRRALAGKAGAVVGEVSVSNVYKRPKDLLAVLEAIGPEARLVCVGGLEVDQPAARGLRELLERKGLAPQVTWTGYLPGDQLSRTLSALDVYVHTGDRGASTRSTALVSALAHGLPIAAYQGPETPGYLRDGESIVLAEPFDARSLAAGVVRLLQDEKLRRRVSAGARRVYERHLTWGRIAQQVLAA